MERGGERGEEYRGCEEGAGARGRVKAEESIRELVRYIHTLS